MSIQNSINAPLPLAVNQGGTGNSAELANNQVWLGNGTNTPSITTLAGSGNVSLVNTSGMLTINGIGSPSITFIQIGSNINPMVAFTGYISTSVSPLTFTLPVSPNFGDIFIVQALYAGLTIQSGSMGPTINYNGGSFHTLSTSVSGACITLTCSTSIGSFGVLNTNGIAFTGS